MKSKEQIRLSLIVARAKNGVIGRSGEMPWRIPSEMAHFKRTTLGKPVLMGRKTWDSLYLKPLLGRDNLVLSRDKGFLAKDAESFTDFDAMKRRGEDLARACGSSEIVVIGGALLYALALPFADRVYLTDINAEPAGDVWFDDLCSAQWRLSSVETGKQGPSDEHPYFIKIFDRRTSAG